MKLTVKAGALKSELALAMTIVQDKPPIPTLAGVLVTADAMATRANMAATDTAIAIRGHFEAKIDEPGTMVLPARKLFEILKTLGLETDVVLTHVPGKNDTTIQAGTFKSRLSSWMAEDFPKIPDDFAGGGMLLKRAVLRALIERTKFCVKGSGSQAYDQSAQLFLLPPGVKDPMNGSGKTGKPLMVLVATDGHRLAAASGEGPGEVAGQAVSELIPRQALVQLDQMLEGDGPDVDFMSTETHLFFKIGDRLIVSRRMDGKFPAWERIVPKNSLILEADRGALAGILKRVALIVEGVGTRQVKFSLGKDRLGLAAVNAQIGEGEDSVAAKYDGEVSEVALNPGYVADFLDVVGGDRVQMEAGGKTLPVLWRPVGPSGDYLYVVMPMSM